MHSIQKSENHILDHMPVLYEMPSLFSSMEVDNLVEVGFKAERTTESGTSKLKSGETESGTTESLVPR